MQGVLRIFCINVAVESRLNFILAVRIKPIIIETEKNITLYVQLLIIVVISNIVI